MSGSKSIKERSFLLDRCYRIIFNSNWSKKRFLQNMKSDVINSEKLVVINQSASRNKINFNKKEKIIHYNQVEIYILPDCPWSARAIRMLRTLQVEHEIKVIKNDNDFKLLNKMTKYSSFPQIFINGEFIGGYSELAELHSSGKLID